MKFLQKLGFIISPALVSTIISCGHNSNYYKKKLNFDFSYQIFTKSNLYRVDRYVHSLAPNDKIKLVIKNFNLKGDTYTSIIKVKDLKAKLLEISNLNAKKIGGQNA